MKVFRQKGTRMKFDLHMHTRRYSPDSVTDPFDLLKAALAAGLDGIVITEHDRLWPEKELDELRAAAPGLVVLNGVEVTGTGGDVLCYGVTDASALPRGIGWPELCREVHRQGGVAVAAHPNRWGQPFEEIVREQRPELDGIEVMSNNMDADLRGRAAELLAKFPHFAQLGNSDSHDPATVGGCYTDFDCEIRTTADLVAAIRGKRGVAVANGRRQPAKASRASDGTGFDASPASSLTRLALQNNQTDESAVTPGLPSPRGHARR
jgi:predicted metal-dependent phosphoesterase TrpH